MGGGCTFIRLLAEGKKKAALSASLIALKKGEESPLVFSVNPEKISLVPGSPFAYWVSDQIRRLFQDLPPLEIEGRTIKQGLATADDFRFVRLWWEIKPSSVIVGDPETENQGFRLELFEGKKWAPFTKGGEFSPYYSDVHLVVNWESDGENIKEYRDPRSGKQFSRPQNTDYYFRPGLTWPKLPLKRGSFSYIPPGVIFSHGGMMIFAPENDIWALISLLNTDAYIGLLHLLMPRGIGDTGATLKYEIGYIKAVPIPELSEIVHNELEEIAKKNWVLMASLQVDNELSHIFITSSSAHAKFMNIQQSNEEQQQSIFATNKKIFSNFLNADEIAFTQYGINSYDKGRLRKNIGKAIVKIDISNNNQEEELLLKTKELISYTIGAIFGRWDIRYAIGEKESPELPDPFAPLPACSPGMLQGEDGLPLEPHEIPADYPLAVDGDGILVDDEGHPDDIIARIRDVLTIIWGNRADAIEKEACEILGMKSLRDYFRKPGSGGFWDDHIKRYSKSRRKAPIYWLLQSVKKNYSIWIYYPRMDGDTLYKALRYTKDKLAMEERRLEDMKCELSQLGTGGAAVKRLEKEIDGQEAFISDLHDFVEKLERAASLDLIPEHDDGVVLTIAPLHELVPWKEPKKYWDELIDGKYEWSSIGKQIREKGLVKG